MHILTRRTENKTNPDVITETPNESTPQHHHQQQFIIAKGHLESSTHLSSHLYEPFYNLAVVNFEHEGDIQASYHNVNKSLNCFPGHDASLELKKRIKRMFL